MKKLVLALIVMASLNSCSKECTCETTEQKTLTSQPGPDNGHDTYVIYRETDGNFYANANHDFNHDLMAVRWTWNGEGAGEGSGRGLLKFPELSTVPVDAVITSAKLYLYGKSNSAAIPQGNSYYPGSGYASFGTNDVWLKRVLGNWEETTVTWNTKPATTDVNQATINASTSQWNYDAEVDVTAMVKDMVSNNQNYGFCMQLKTEQIYRSLLFSTSEATDPSKRPKLVVNYEVKK